MISAVALCPSEVPVIVVVPAASPRTTPNRETVATAGLEELQAKTRLGRGVAPASNACPVTVNSAPTFTVAVAGATATEATATLLTVRVTLRLRPSDVAVIAVLPTAPPVTIPSPSTLAIAGSALENVMVRLARAVPSALRATAVRGAVAPTPTTGSAGSRDTLATGTSGPGPTGSPPPAARNRAALPQRIRRWSTRRPPRR